MSYFTSITSLKDIYQQRAEAYDAQVLAFQERVSKASIVEMDDLLASNIRPLANGRGYSMVFSRVFQALVCLEKQTGVEGVSPTREQIETEVRNVYNYFIDGVLRSTSSACSSAVTNVQEDSKRDGVLRGLKDIRFEFGF